MFGRALFESDLIVTELKTKCSSIRYFAESLAHTKLQSKTDTYTYICDMRDENIRFIYHISILNCTPTRRTYERASKNNGYNYNYKATTLQQFTLAFRRVYCFSFSTL